MLDWTAPHGVSTTRLMMVRVGAGRNPYRVCLGVHFNTQGSFAPWVLAKERFLRSMLVDRLHNSSSRGNAYNQ